MLDSYLVYLHRLPKSKPSVEKDHLSSVGSRGHGRLPQRPCVADIMVHSTEYSPLCPYQSSSEDSSSEHSSSSYSSPGRDGPTEIPTLCPPPYGFHFSAQKKGVSNFCTSHKTTSQSRSSLGHNRAIMEDCPLSPEDQDMEKCFLSPPPVACNPPQRQLPERALSPRRILKPPPPYTRLIRTPSLKEYPSHTIRLLPREIVSEELKSWHQRQSSMSTRSPTSPHSPSFKQVGNVPV